MIWYNNKNNLEKLIFLNYINNIILHKLCLHQIKFGQK
jgi:hypothetical protein